MQEHRPRQPQREGTPKHNWAPAAKKTKTNVKSTVMARRSTYIYINTAVDTGAVINVQRLKLPKSRLVTTA